MSNPIAEESRIGVRETCRLLIRTFRYVLPYKGRFLLKALLLIISQLPVLIVPWPMKILIDHGILGMPVGESPTPYLPFMQPFLDMLSFHSQSEIVLIVLGVGLVLALMIGNFTGRAQAGGTSAGLMQGTDTATQTENEANTASSAVGGVFGLMEYRVHLGLTQRLNHYFRSSLFRRVQSLPMTVFDDEKIGDAVYRVMYDTPAITDMCFKATLTPVAGMVQVFLVFHIMSYSYSSVPAIIYGAFAYVPLFFLIAAPYSGAMRRRSERSREAGSSTTATMEEGLGNMLAVQSLGGEAREKGRFDRDSKESYRKYRRVIVMGIWYFISGIPVSLFFTAYVGFVTQGAIIRGQMTIGDYGVLIAYYWQLAYWTWALGTMWFSLQASVGGLRRVFALMDMQGELDLTGKESIETVREGVTMEKAGYTYPDGTQALREIDFAAGIGEVVALVGPTGAGKTSLAYLIPRFLDAGEGSVRIDGRDVKEIRLESLRKQVSFVFQEGTLFADTIEANIRMGKPDATDMQIQQAAHIAGADEFIEKLPQGYKTLLGRSGGTLSVGQKQRLSIARGLVQDARILILDEPTSALDPETEYRLVHALHEAARTRLVIIIAHRLSTIRTADRICFLQQGEILEQGSHDDLMVKEGGHYRRFVELQTRGAP